MYGDWADHDELGKPNVQVQLTQQQTLVNVALLEEQAKAQGALSITTLLTTGGTTALAT